MTNEVALSGAEKYLQIALEWNQHLLGLPAVPLIIVGCICFGYLLKAWPHFDNARIPSWVVLFGVLFYIGLTTKSCLDDVKEAKTKLELLIFLVSWGFRSTVLGLVAGVLAIAAHRVVLRRFEEKYGWFAAIQQQKEESKRYRKAADGSMEEVKENSQPKTKE